MSVCKTTTSELSALSAALWSIVKENEVEGFPNAVQIAVKLFKALPNLISTNTFCDIILDLKIKALLPVMSNEEGFNHAKAFGLLNSLFPVKDEEMEIKSSKYQIRHRKVRTRLLQLLAEDESRLIYIRDFLKYGSCGCLTRVIQERVKEFIDVVNQHIETVGTSKSLVTICEERTSTSSVSLSTVTRSLQPTSTLIPITETKQEAQDHQSRTSIKTIVGHMRQQVLDMQSYESISVEMAVRSNHDRYEDSQPEKANINEQCKRRKLEETEELLGGVDATSNGMERKDLSPEKKEKCSNDASKDSRSNQTAAEQSSNSVEESTVRVGIAGSYSRCAMT